MVEQKRYHVIWGGGIMSVRKITFIFITCKRCITYNDRVRVMWYYCIEMTCFLYSSNLCRFYYFPFIYFPDLCLRVFATLHHTASSSYLILICSNIHLYPLYEIDRYITSNTQYIGLQAFLFL